MAGKFRCDAGAREYAWKTELAGKRAKCKCGTSLAVPMEDPEKSEISEESDAGAYDVVESPPEAVRKSPPPAPALSPIRPLAYSTPPGAAPARVAPVVAGQGRCQICGVSAPTKHVEFHQNVGMLVMRFHRAVRGNLCKSCIHEKFWKMTGITLAVGWLGVISCILAPIFVINNIIRYISCLSLPSSQAEKLV
jgi:hypothetical protein